MLYLMGTYENARQVAKEVGLIEGRDWTLLDVSWKLMGTHEPDVVLLGTYDRVKGLTEMMDLLYARSATVWSELDLRKGRVR
jgi:hypothetical protein